MKVLIVGAGIGGLSLAAFLNETSVDYDIIDKANNFENQGFTLGFWQNGRRMLSKLGLAEKFDENSTFIKCFKIYRGDGKLLRQYDFQDFIENYGIAHAQLSRKLLHDWLEEKIEKKKFHLGIKISKIEKRNNRYFVEFINGNSQEYDLIVGADGVNSQIREMFFGTKPLIKRHWRLWYMWVDSKHKLSNTVKEYLEAREFMAVFDSGDKTLVVVSAPIDKVEKDNVSDRLIRLKKSLRNIINSSDILTNVDPEQIVISDVVAFDLSNWYKEGIVLLGDAAHGFEPYGGLGGSMAMEDAYVLSAKLIEVSDKKMTLVNALREYESVRKKRINKAMRITRRMRSWSTVNSILVRKFLDLLAPIFPKRYLLKDYIELMNEEI